MSDEIPETAEVFSADEIEALRNAPAEVIVANHVFHLLELAAVHLSSDTPDLRAAQLVIDAAAAVIGALGARLGEASEVLGEGLAQIQLAYVTLAKRTD
jgi:hypothetical protein